VGGPGGLHGPALSRARRWCLDNSIPDLFSIRHTTAEAYLKPIVHEIKVSRAALLGDLKRQQKHAACLSMASQGYCVSG
jgi:tryptophan 2,3-dioxygenase